MSAADRGERCLVSSITNGFFVWMPESVKSEMLYLSIQLTIIFFGRAKEWVIISPSPRKYLPWKLDNLLAHCQPYPTPRNVIVLNNASQHTRSRIRDATEVFGLHIHPTTSSLSNTHIQFFESLDSTEYLRLLTYI